MLDRISRVGCRLLIVFGLCGSLSIPRAGSGDEPPTATENTATENTASENTADNDEQPTSGSAKKAVPTEELRGRLSAATKKIVDNQTFDLRYKFQPGETVSWTAQHMIAQETRVKDTAQTAKSRSVSTKVWKIVEAGGADGRIVLEYSIDDVDMWQHVTGRPEVRYNSRDDGPPPREYQSTAEKLGVPLALVTMDDRGTVIDKTYPTAKVAPPLSELVIPLPKKPVRISEQWSWTEETRLGLEDKRVLRVQMRHLYTLKAVEKNQATISIRTEVLTPINDPKIRGRLLERMKNGTARFDLDSGRVVAMQLDLDETVIGFAGAESSMDYKARFLEDIIVGPPPARPTRAAPSATATATATAKLPVPK